VSFPEWPETGRDFVTIAFKCALEYVLKRFQESQEVLTLNGTHQLLACAEDVNIVGQNVEITKKKHEVLIHASKRLV
jgi:hypothetical protein